MSNAQNIPVIIKVIMPIIDQYGYIGVAGLIFLEDFGLPTPGETSLIAAAVLAGLGHLNIFLVILIAFISAVAGDNIGFAIGLYGGHPLVEKLGKYVFLTPDRINKAESRFRKQGGKIVVIARFIDGLRQLNGILAGLSEMQWMKFLSLNALGAMLWVLFWSSIGYFGSNYINQILRYQLYVTILVIVLIVGYIAVRLLRRKRSNKSNNVVNN